MINPNKEIYQVYLIGVNPRENIEFNNNKSENMKKAILEQKTLYLAKIMVQETNKPDTFKEIITGKEYISSIIYDEFKNYLPVYFSNNNLNKSILIKPIIYTHQDKKFKNKKDIYNNGFNKATYENLKDYLEKNQAATKYLSELNELDQIAEQSYQALKTKKEIEKMKVRQLIRQHNEKYKK